MLPAVGAATPNGSLPGSEQETSTVKIPLLGGSSTQDSSLPAATAPVPGLGTAVGAGVNVGQSLAEFVEHAVASLRDVADQTGFLLAPTCNFTFPAGNAGIMAAWEVTQKDPMTGERRVDQTNLYGGSLSNSLAGGFSYRYSTSTDPDREGHNYALQAMKRPWGFGLGDSELQGPTANFWKMSSWGVNLGPELFRVDFMAPLHELIPALRPVLVAVQNVPGFNYLQHRFRIGIKCGGAFMIRSPALRYVPMYNLIGRMVEGLVGLRHRVVNNRENYQNEPDLSTAVSSAFLNPMLRSHGTGVQVR